MKRWLITTRNYQYFSNANTASEIVNDLPAGVSAKDIVATSRMTYADGKSIVTKDWEINHAVRQLIQHADAPVCLMTNNGNAPYIIPALINGAVEYQVSDDFQLRGKSYDAYTWSEALANFEKMKAENEPTSNTCSTECDSPAR